MWLKWLFNKIYKIIIGFNRLGGKSIPRVSEAKQFGNIGEDEVYEKLKEYLPSSKIKRNLITQTVDGNAEIDFLVLCDKKLFAIEVKHWKGTIVETEQDFIKYKNDKYTDEIHTKTLKSPFKQLWRAVSLLKKQIPINAWINTIVFFDGADCVQVGDGQIWFNNINDMSNYILNGGKASFGNNAKLFFEKCVSADVLHRGSSHLNCIICDQSLRFSIGNVNLTRKDIDYIKFFHHWSYDELHIYARNGMIYKKDFEDESIKVNENGKISSYPFSKLDCIELAKR